MLPLRHPGQHRAPWSPASCTRLPQSSMFPSSCSTGWERLSATLVASRRSAFSSRIPAATPGHSLAFDSLTSCEVDDILRSGCYPCVIQANTEPPGSLPPSPGSYIHRCCSISRAPLWSTGPTALSSAFADSHTVVFALRHPLVDVGHATQLSFAQSRCRPTASSVCTLPLSLWAGKNPLAATILRQAPTVAPVPKNGPFA
jgi:hypothetical protein